MKKAYGFTIIEVMTVIVILSMLVAITAVSYTGIQTRARTTASEANAQAVAKKALSYYNINAAFPSTVTAFKSGSGEAAMDTRTKNLIQTAAPNATTHDKVQYRYCDSGRGAQIVWWNSSEKTLKTIQIKSATSCVSIAS